jgi:hypothetical protein
VRTNRFYDIALPLIGFKGLVLQDMYALREYHVRGYVYIPQADYTSITTSHRTKTLEIKMCKRNAIYHAIQSLIALETTKIPPYRSDQEHHLCTRKKLETYGANMKQD